MADAPNQESKIKNIKEAEKERAKARGIRTMAEDISMLSGGGIKKETPKKRREFTTPNFLRRILTKEETPKEKLEKPPEPPKIEIKEKREEIIPSKEVEKEKIELAKLKEKKEAAKKEKEEGKLRIEMETRKALEAKIEEEERRRKEGKLVKAPNFFQKLFLRGKEVEEKVKEKEEERGETEEAKIETKMAAAKLKEEIQKKKELERLEKREEIRRTIEERLKKEEEERKNKEEERQQILKEREERGRFKIREPEEEIRKVELRKKIERKLKIPPPPEPILPEKPRGLASPLPGIFISILLLASMAGLLIFLKNYQLKPSLPPSPTLPKAQIASLPLPPSTPTHKECQGLKCIVVEGEGPDLCKTNENCKPVLPPIAIDISEEIPLSNLSSDIFIPLLDKKFQKEYPPGTFIEIVPKYKGKLLTISQLFQALDLHPPKDVKDNLETYTLYLYSQKELFVQQRRNRLGIAFRIKEGKIGIVRTAMNQWEKVLPDDFYKVHTLWKRGQKASPNFLDNSYKGIHIRYTNFPVPDLSIDWAIKKDILILTTSRESMWRTIDIIK